MTDNAADFPVGSKGKECADVEAAIIEEMRARAGEQLSGTGAARQSTSDKADDLDDLSELIRHINLAANAFESPEPGSDKMFRLPRNRSQQNLLATARAFHADATPMAATFVEYGLPANFLETLQALIDEIDAAGFAAASGTEQQAGATAGLMDAARRGTDNSRRLDAIVRIKYNADPQKLAAWTVASHLERAPKSAAPKA